MESIDARQLLQGLVGQTIPAMTGRPNKIVRVEGEDAMVATGKSPTGKLVPIGWVQDALENR